MKGHSGALGRSHEVIVSLVLFSRKARLMGAVMRRIGSVRGACATVTSTVYTTYAGAMHVTRKKLLSKEMPAQDCIQLALTL
jgi:hypothetical protein